jgi:hypothetical protein
MVRPASAYKAKGAGQYERPVNHDDQEDNFHHVIGLLSPAAFIRIEVAYCVQLNCMLFTFPCVFIIAW